MGKLRDIWLVIRGGLSTERVERLNETAALLYQEVKQWKQKAANAQALGEALARGGSDEVAKIAMENVKTHVALCTHCGQATLHYKTGHCVRCGILSCE